jgi:hypothetical protein
MFEQKVKKWLKSSFCLFDRASAEETVERLDATGEKQNFKSHFPTLLLEELGKRDGSCCIFVSSSNVSVACRH